MEAQVVRPVNPFDLMTNPQAVFQAIERSERLQRLQSRVCRPLDKPQPGELVEADDPSIDNDAGDTAQGS
jgi:hypothetical protein